MISVTMVREAIDDIRRWRRDKELNGKKYKKLTREGIVQVKSADIKVGDLIVVEKVVKFYILMEKTLVIGGLDVQPVCLCYMYIHSEIVISKGKD